jgi:hypothetical protein
MCLPVSHICDDDKSGLPMTGGSGLWLILPDLPGSG